MFRTLEVKKQIGDSIVGTARLGTRHGPVEVGKLTPMLRKSEEPEGLVRARFLDSSVPLEVNLLHYTRIRTVLQRLALRAESGWLNPQTLIRSRPTVTYVPPDALLAPTQAGLEALGTTGITSQRVAAIRAGTTDATFWKAIADAGVYTEWFRELALHSDTMGASLMAPPVPVLHADLGTSADGQRVLNAAAAALWRQRLEADGSGDIVGAAMRQRQLGLLYSLHVHPSTFRNRDLLQTALRALSTELNAADNPFWGVHLHLYDIGLASGRGRPETAKAFIAEVARIAADAGRFLWVSDAGAVGPVLLDLGAAFTTYHSGMTPGRTYGEGGGPGDRELQYGKIIELWRYNLYDRSYVKDRNWTVEDTTLFPNVVPMPLRSATPQKWRVGFSRPHNIAVLERINALRVDELRRGNVAPGKSHVGKSNDDRIAPWAA